MWRMGKLVISLSIASEDVLLFVDRIITTGKQITLPTPFISEPKQYIWNSDMNETAKVQRIEKMEFSKVDFNEYETVLDVFHSSVQKYRNKTAYSNMGKELTFGDIDRLSADFASYLQNFTNLKPGDRIAIQMPNLLQFPVVAFGALRAGLVVVNTNPLYTAREMEHQFNDAGCKALVAVANFGDLVEEVLPKTSIETVIITQIGDLLGGFKRVLVNAAVKHVKKMVPKYELPDAISFHSALSKGASATFSASFNPRAKDLAVLQYTGGTTGVAKGAMLSHGNLVANMIQVKGVLTDFKEGNEIMITPLPLYHIFSFAVNCLAMMEKGCQSVLITNPRDIPAFVKELKKYPFTAMTGLNTLFVALLNNKDFRNIDFSHFKLTIAGGMALQTKVAKEWEEVTGCPICEGYGLTETSPVVTVNPPDAIQLGTIGIPLVGTQLKVIDDDENTLGVDQPGELCVFGPQVMQGYWQRPEATEATMTKDGWFKTGDVAVIQENGYVRIVDRKKDMILVSGFNVYPNELEEVLAGHPDVFESAAVGVPDEKSGEVVKMFVVSKSGDLTKEEVIAFMKDRVTGYKVPKHVEFRDELPKTNVGKILRRQLRDD